MTRDEFKAILRQFVSTDEYLDALIDRPDVLLMLKHVDENGERVDRVEWVNSALCEVMGKSFAELCGRPASENWPDADQYHADDVEILNQNTMRANYMESAAQRAGTAQLSTKGPVHITDTGRYVLVQTHDLQRFGTQVRRQMIRGEVGRVFYEVSATDVLRQSDRLIRQIETVRATFEQKMRRIDNIVGPIQKPK